MARNQSGRRGRSNSPDSGYGSNSSDSSPPNGQSQNRNNHNGRSNYNGNAMNVDSNNGVPVTNNNNNARSACHNCGQTGHQARHCQQNNNQNRNQNHGQSNHQSHHRQNQFQNQSQTPPTCTFCNRIGHTQAQCHRDPSNNRNQSVVPHSSSKTDPSTKPSPSAPTLPMSGWTFANAIPTVRPTAHYCAACNTRDHSSHLCPHPQNCARVQHSVLTCWKCGFRGHTGDECQNPDPAEHTKRCGVCRATGHSADKCANTLQRRLLDAVTAGSGRGRNRFAWGQDAVMSGMATPQQQLPQITYTTSAQPISTATTASPGPARLAALRAKVLHSATLYPLRLYNRVIANNSTDIQRYLLDQRTWMLLSAKIAQGFQFWRDPRAMHAIATQQRPYCYACRSEGVILDRNMCGIGERDALGVEDFAEWGIFVMFRCGCSREGFEYR